MVKHRISFYLVGIVFCTYFGSYIHCQNIFFPRRFVYKQDPEVLFKVRHDPAQVKPRKVTRNNMFAWLNPKNAVRFHLWSRDNPHLAHEIFVDDMESIKTSSFNPKRLTKFIIHGYQDNANELNISDWIIFMKDAFLSLADVNVIAVDYSFYAILPFYLIPFHEVVGEKLTDMIQFLVSQDYLELDAVHLIGWSWGAHVSGVVGKALGGKIGRITGLDPAGPTFKFVDDEFRLAKTDAKFVDVIHTNAGTRLIWGAHFGLKDPIGHVDIYPNGGERQTGCPAEHTFNVASLLCNHGRAARYFTESITSPLAFPMCPCEDFDKFIRDECKCSPKDYAYLGEHISRKTRGIFQIITRSQSPYGHGPHLNVSLTSLLPNELQLPNRNYVRPTRMLNATAMISRENEEFKIQFKNMTMSLGIKNNRYRSGKYPNDDVLKLSLYAYKMMKEKERENS